MMGCPSILHTEHLQISPLALGRKLKHKDLNI